MKRTLLLLGFLLAPLATYCQEVRGQIKDTIGRKLAFMALHCPLKHCLMPWPWYSPCLSLVIGCLLQCHHMINSTARGDAYFMIMHTMALQLAHMYSHLQSLG